MSLEYDFDIVEMEPGEAEGGQIAANATGPVPVRALFRDVKTADALRGASPKIRKIFLDAGFGLDTPGSVTPRGFYLPEDAEARERILRNLFSNIKSMGVQGEYSGEFDFRQFLNHVRTARPLVGVSRRESQGDPRPAPQTATKPERRTVPGRIGFALGLAVILFVLLKFLAAAGASP